MARFPLFARAPGIEDAEPRAGARRHRSRPLPVLLLVVALLVLAACGSDDDGRPEAQPAPDVGSFTEGGLDEIPLPPRAEPAGDPSEKDDVQTRSYTVPGTTPDEVVEFYVSALDGWEHRETEDVGTAVRGDFVRDDRGLRVTAQPAPTVDRGADGDAVVELSLQLGPPASVFIG